MIPFKGRDTKVATSQEHIIRLEIPSEIQLIYVLDAVVSEILREMEFDDEAVEQANLAVIEAGTNAILHGNSSDPNKRVYFQFLVGEDKLTVIVKDEGEGFNPDLVPNPLDLENLLSTSGRGIFLMRTFMDEVNYSENGTKVQMVKYKFNENK
ncbi:TPA: ATP-binding protein [Candidatus Poribacteria bacterium]|nr:ATP-binding protein [Candidatus Poribacteria bacterium]